MAAGMNPEAERAGELALGAGEVVAQALVIGQDLLRPVEERGAFGGQADEAVVADHQADVQLFLELVDRRRQRRLGDVAGRRGAREMTLAGEGDEIGEVADEHLRLGSAVAVSRLPDGGGARLSSR